MAEAVAFQTTATLDDHTLDPITANALPDAQDPQAPLEQLQQLGYVRQSSNGSEAREPGIPSLMDYVLRHHPQAAANPGPRP